MTNDQPVPIEVKTLEVFGGRQGQIGHFRFQSGLFLAIHNSGRNIGFAIHLAEPQVNQASLAETLKKFEKAGLRYTPDCEVKLIGTDRLIEAARSLLLKLEVAVKSSLTRQLEAEIFFYPQSGRIRVSAEKQTGLAKTVAASAPVAFSKDRRIRVLIIDDSKSMQQLLGKILGRDPFIEVVAAASLPSEVEGLIALHKPDVLTMDIHMPEMDGVRLVQILMPKYFIPTVMISSVSLAEGPLVLAALEAGAVDYIQKPVFAELEKAAPVIIEKVKNAALANTARLKTNRVAQSPRARSPGQKLDLETLIAIGSSTGGTEALRVILTALPKEIPPVLIVQHIPAVFSLAFANRMNDLCPFEVKEAVDGDLVLPGRVLIAPGGFQMRVKKQGASLKVVITEEPPFNRHRPSVDILFDSVAAEVKRTKLIGMILTGMGADGAKGLLKLKQAGAKTIAQSKETCVVFGMPNEAIQLGAADQVVDLHLIADQLLSLLSMSRAA